MDRSIIQKGRLATTEATLYGLSAPLRLVLLLGLLLAGAPLVSVAQEGTADDTEDFATALADNGFFEIAEEVIEKGLATAKGPDDRAKLEFARGLIRAEKGARNPDRTLRVQALKGAADAFDAYLKQFPNSPKAAEVRFRMSELLRQAGEAAVDQMKVETDPAKKDELRTLGLNFFSKATQQTESRIADLQLISQPTEEQLDELRALQFQVGKLAYSQALLYENRKGTNAQACISRAKDVFENFEIDYPGHPLTFECRRLFALILIDDEDFAGAQEQIDSNCDRLREALNSETRSEIIGDPVVIDIVGKSFYEKAKFHLNVKKPSETQEAIKTVEEADKLMPGLVKTFEGKQALLLLSQAYLADGQADKAKHIAERVAGADESGTSGFAARELLDRLQGSAEGGLVKMLESAVSRRDITAAESISRRILSKTADPKIAKDAPETLFLLGTMYRDTGRPIEAAACFNALADDYAKSKVASEAKFEEARCYAMAKTLEKASQTGGAKYWEGKRDAALNELNRRFPDSEEAKQASFISAGIAKEDDRNEEAADLFAKVPSSSPKFAEAQLEAGTICLKLGLSATNREQADEAKKRYAKAEEHLVAARDAFIRLAKSTLNDAEIKRNNDQAFLARIRLAGLYLQPQTRNPEKTISLLADAEKEVKEREKLSMIWSLRIKGYIQLKRGKEAADLLEKFQKESKSGGAQGAVADAALGIAAALDEEATEKAKAKATAPEAVSLWREAAKFYRLAAEDAKRGNPSSRKQFEGVGSRLVFIAGRLMGMPDDLPLLSIEPEGKISEAESIERAADAFYIASQEASDANAEINVDRQRAIARCNALLGKWAEAATALEQITNAYPLVGNDGKLNKDSVQKVQGLAFIYQDLAVAYIRAGAAKKDEFYFDKAGKIIVDVSRNAERDGQLAWECQYLNLVNLYERRDYSKLGAYFQALERSSPDLDGNKFGVKDKILQLKRAAGSKIIDK